MNKVFRFGRRITALAVAAALIGGMGCATIMDLDQPNSNIIHKEGDVLLTDSIIALGTPDAALAQSINNPHAVAFLGKAQTYLLVEGGEQILKFAHQLDGNKLTLTADSHSLYLRDKTVWGNLRFRYDPNGQVLTEDQETVMRNLGFRKMGDAYIATVEVKGAVYPALDLQSKGFQALTKPRDLVFRSPPTEEKTPNIAKFALLPVAIGVDIVTAPLQLLGATVVLIVFTHQDHK